MNALININKELSVPEFVYSINRLGTFEEWNKLINKKDGFGYSYWLREEHIKALGFPILTAESVEILANYIGNSKVADLGCGTGYLSAALKNLHGIDVTAVDSYETQYNVGKMNKFQYTDMLNINMHDLDLSKFNGVILSWPDYGGNDAFKIASKLKSGQFLIYQGEGCGGCTADDDFHELIENEELFKRVDSSINENHIQFFGVHDKWYIFERI